MFCPVCKSELIKAGTERLESLVEHVGDPNGTPSMKDVYRCSDPSCATHMHNIRWIKDGERYGGSLVGECSFIDDNDAPFGSQERAANVEVYKKDENFTLLNLYWVKWEVIYSYNADTDGKILNRWRHIEVWIKRSNSGYFLYISGIRLFIRRLRCFLKLKKAVETDSNVWAAKTILVSRDILPHKNKLGHKFYIVYTNLFYASVILLARKIAGFEDNL